MNHTNSQPDGQNKIVIRIRLRKPNLANIGKVLLATPGNIYSWFMSLQLRYRFIAAIGVILLAELYSLLSPFFEEKSYALGKAENLLSEVSPEMAEKIKFDQSQQLFSFNKDPKNNPDAVGANGYATAIAHKDPTKGVTITDAKNNVDLTMTPKFGLQTGRQEQNRIVYPLSDGSGWAIYTMEGVGVKEDIILNYAHGDSASYAYTLKLGDGLQAKLQKDGSIGIFGNSLLSGNITAGSDKDSELLMKARQNAPKNDLLFSIPAPVVIDKNGQSSDVTAKYSLKDSELTIAVSGLQKANYPLSIDPSIYVATAQQFMAGNNETNVNFDVNNKLIKKGRTTGARFDSWQTTASLPTAKWGAQTIPTGGYLYSIGGTTSSSTSASVNWAQLNTSTGAIENADPGTGQCSTWCTNSAYDLPGGRSNYSLVAYNGFLYAMGGTNSSCTTGNGTGDSSYCKTVYIAKIGANGEPRLWHPTDSNTNNWVYWYRDTDLPTERAFSSAVAYNNRMYFMGGRTASGATNTVHIADVTQNGKLGTWSSSGSTLPSNNQYGASAQVYNDRLYIVGGSSSPTAAPTNTVYYNKINSSGALSTWTQTTSFATGRISGGGNIAATYGAYIYISGGCSAVNGSGYCTTTQGDTQIASINTDGSLDNWSTVSGITDSRLGHSLFSWRNRIYQVGGCSAQDTTTGDCNSNLLSSIKYGLINQDGDTSTVSSSSSSGNATCVDGDPYGCDLPSASIGNVLNATAVINGYLYIMGGCTNDACSTVSSGIAYTAIGSDGSLKKPSTCSGSFTDSYCISSISLPTGLAATGTAVFNNRIYLVGGIGTGTNVYYATSNSDGSLGSWSNSSLSSISSSTVSTLSYTYAYVRANPSSAGTNPGNLYIIGGCTNASVTCSGYSQAVLKCNIGTSGAPSSCSTSGQLQIGTIPNSCGTGIGAVAGTVYANYIYLIGGITTNCSNLKTTRYAKFDSSNNIVTVGTGWTEGANQTTTGRQRGAGFGYNGYLYVVGGYDSSGGGVLNDIELAKINTSDGSWGTWNNSHITVNQRWGVSVPVSNSYAYVIGGCSAGAAPTSCSSRSNTVQTFQLYNNNSGAPAGYSTSANTFSTDQNRVGIASVVLNGYIYAAGGCTSSPDYCTALTSNVSYAAIDSYGNISTWSNTTGSLPAARSWGKLKAAGGTLYYVGGEDSSATAQTTIYYATPASGNVSSWSTATTSLPNPRSDFGMAVWNDRLYVVGGKGSGTGCTSGVCNTVYVSSSQTNGGNITSWNTTNTSFNVARSGLVAIAYANNLYVLGGFNGSNYLSDTQYAQISTADADHDGIPDGTVGSWTYSESLPQPLSQGDGFAINGYVYLMGGRSAGDTCSPISLVAPISANTTIASGNNPTGIGSWFVTNQRYSGPRFGNGAVYADGKAYVVGGMNCSGSISYTSAGSYSYVVPSGVTSLTVKTWGGGGGAGGSGWSSTGIGGEGGGGGYSTSTITTTPGETLSLAVGGGGNGGVASGGCCGQGAGGGGGGYSSIYRSSTPLLIAAGGGGGGGGNKSGSTSFGSVGGGGGGTTGVAGTNSLAGFLGGGGGTASAGGAGGTGGTGSGTAGSSLAGGVGGARGGSTTGRGVGGTPGGGNGGGYYNFAGTTVAGGGGGGGGYYGGGGGSSSNSTAGAAGGGGGSSYLTGGSSSTTAGSGVAAGNSNDADRGTAGNGGAAGGVNVSGSAGNAGRIVLILPSGVSPVTPVVQQTVILSQPQVAKYSIMLDTDSDVFPTHWLLNGVDNSIGARWQLKYRSATDATKATVSGGPDGRNCSTGETMSTWGSETSFGNVTLGLPGIYTPRDSSNNNTNCARYYYFNVTVDSSQAYGYPDDVSRGPTITDLTLNMTADPAKRLMHGRTFTGGLQMPIDTPYYSN